jgi:hypothetical protein
VTRYAENFDLSEDGLVAATVNAGTVVVFKLPPPSAQDVKDLEEARSFSPPKSEAAVSFAKLEQQQQEEEAEAEGSSAAADVAAEAPVGNPASGSGKMVPAADVTAGDVAGAGSGGGKAADAAAGAGPVVAAKTDVAQRDVAAAGGTSDGQAPGDGSTSGDPDSSGGGVRKPPTLLQPGEKVDTIKAPATAQQQSPSR